MESQSQMSAVRRREDFVIEETGAEDGERLRWIYPGELVRTLDSYWSEHVLGDPLRALCLQSACERLSPVESQDLVLHTRLRLLHAPAFSPGLDGFNVLIADEIDQQKARRIQRKSVPPRSKHLAA